MGSEDPVLHDAITDLAHRLVEHHHVGALVHDVDVEVNVTEDNSWVNGQEGKGMWTTSPESSLDLSFKGQQAGEAV